MTMKFTYSLYHYWYYDFHKTPCLPEPDGWLDTLHVLLSGQPNATSKPKGLHTGFSGPLVLSLKAPLVICSYKKKDLLLTFYRNFHLYSPQKKHVVCPAVCPAQDEDWSTEKQNTVR